jgi:hypothetical protein
MGDRTGKLDREERLRIGSDGRLLDASETYMIRSVADADPCDFLVEEGLLDSGRAAALAQAFEEAEKQLIGSKNKPAHGSFLWMRELASSRPNALPTVVDLVRAGMASTARFYRLEAPLFPDLVKLTKLGMGMAHVPPRKSGTYLNAKGQQPAGFAGHIFISECQGGALYFPSLDMAIEPKLGRLVAAPNGSDHEQALLRVEEGALFVLSFAMRFRRERTSPDLRRIF